MKKIFFISTLVFSLSLLSCNNTKTYKDKLQISHENLDPQELTIKEYNKVLFSIDTANFAEGLKKIQNDFPVFLGGDLDDVDAVNYLKAFAIDTFCIRINDLAESKFSNIEEQTEQIKSVYQRLNYYYPGMEFPDTYFYVSGIDYEMPAIMIQPEGILISIDYYLGNEGNIYDYIGMPRFRSVRCQPAYLTRDLAESFYNSYFNRSNNREVLSEMVNAGKRLYFIEALNPSLPDSVLLGYSSKQMQWVNQFEGDVWATMVGNNFLYANGTEIFRNLFGDGPFTQAFSKDAPARLGEYIGLQIVRSYMTNNDVSLQDLLRNEDLQQIFQDSQYKPKK